VHRNILDPKIPGLRILEESDGPTDGVIFQNLWDSAVIGMNWGFRFADGTTASSGSDDLNQIRISPGEVAVAAPNQMIIVDRLQEPERRLWPETQQIPADYMEFLLRGQQRIKGGSEQIQPSVSEEWNERTAEKMRDAYERLGVPQQSIPSVDELKQQLAEGHLQAEQNRRVRSIPDEIRLSWVLFEDGLFYGLTRTAHCLLMLWSFTRKIRSTVTTASNTEFGVDHPLAAEFAEVRRRTASGPDELAHLVEELPDSDRQIIKKILPIPSDDSDQAASVQT
jgi:hypothetical protein